MSLEDARDLADIYEHTGRTIPRHEWVDAIRERIMIERQSASIENLL